ncbi:hypothetical protein D3C78_1340570 [compost metagenome]
MFAVALLALTLTGCGTVMGRRDGPHIGYPDTYYKGTQANVKVLMFGVQGYDGYTSMFCWLSIVCSVALHQLAQCVAIDAAAAAPTEQLLAFG